MNVLAALALVPLFVAPAQTLRPLQIETQVAHQAAEPVAREWVGGVMGTTLEIRAIGPDAEALERAIAAAVAEIQRVEDLMTNWRPSPLEELNAAAGAGPQVVSREIVDVMQLALEVSALTGGVFDVTYAAAGKLWDFKASPPRIPTKAQIAAALANVGYQRVRVDAALSTVEIPLHGRVGLGGIAKGYGVDRAMAVLMEHGIGHGMVNADGDLKALGRKFGAPWEIAIVHPRQRERVIAVIPVANTCVVTSGDYERFFELDGRRYHHILDPRTGMPSTGCMSATVVAPDAALADALATALCVLSPKAGLALAERSPRVEALLVDMAGEVHASRGLRARLEHVPTADAAPQ